ncbi:MAG: hypothetical protein HKN76_15460 [Saprospiraceae bacterium]|nr:hypothetical protein [Saprospiraceae bacterium]
MMFRLPISNCKPVPLIRCQLLLIFLLLVTYLGAQSIYTGSQQHSSKSITADISILRGNAPLFVLEGDLISESLVTTVGLNIGYKSSFSQRMFWSMGFSAYSVASDFNLAPTGADSENIVTLSKFLAAPIKLGLFKDFEKFNVEISAGFEYARLMAQNERNISTTRLVILEEEMVDINQPLVQKNNFQILAGILFSTPISPNLGTYIGVEVHRGLSDLDTTLVKQKTNRIEFRFGVQYAI